jgi:hypothetical protein
MKLDKQLKEWQEGDPSGLLRPDELDNGNPLHE